MTDGTLPAVPMRPPHERPEPAAGARLGGSSDSLGLGAAPFSCEDLGPHTGAGGGPGGDLVCSHSDTEPVQLAALSPGVQGTSPPLPQALAAAPPATAVHCPWPLKAKAAGTPPDAHPPVCPLPPDRPQQSTRRLPHKEPAPPWPHAPPPGTPGAPPASAAELLVGAAHTPYVQSPPRAPPPSRLAIGHAQHIHSTRPQDQVLSTRTGTAPSPRTSSSRRSCTYPCPPYRPRVSPRGDRRRSVPWPSADAGAGRWLTSV